MEKNIETVREHDRGSSGISGLLACALALNVLNLGFQLGRWARGAQDDVSGHVHDIQVYNSQLLTQMDSQFGEVSKLILNGSENTFTFQADVADQNQDCSGKYEIRQDMATAVGPIACTKSITLTK